MAEAEDVLTDAARHATILARDIWRRHRPAKEAPSLKLSDVAERIGLFLFAAFGKSFRLRAAQEPAPPTFLQRLRRKRTGPAHTVALPATDGENIWLPRRLDISDQAVALERYRTLAMQQAMRALRGGAYLMDADTSPERRAIFLLLEAAASDAALATMLPGLRDAIDALRRDALTNRPPVDALPPGRRALEAFTRSLLASPCGVAPGEIALHLSARDNWLQAQDIARRMQAGWKGRGEDLLFRDHWTGEFRQPDSARMLARRAAEQEGVDRIDDRQPHSARLERRPQVRDAGDDEDDKGQGAWMVQTAQPQEHAEDPIGMQRPTDRDEDTAAEEFADSLSELPEARLVSTPGRPKEVLLSDDPPDVRGKREASAQDSSGTCIAYPEWDYRRAGYRERGTLVRLQDPQTGAREWVEVTLAQHAPMLDAIRRRFELLRAHRVRLRKQLDGEDLDLDACVDGYADFRAGRPMPQTLYQTWRPARRDMAISLLIDISGSTDGWISAHRRVIDVEREALLLVCIALQGMGEPFAVQAFSGEGPDHVSIRIVKDFNESYGEEIALRIAALEPERYTRAGAAIRHASAGLMRQSARHRLLLLLSDGKPNDVDDYEGRYGLEDMRQAVIEADWQGISTFCLTIDRQATAYLPQVFGVRRYALLPHPERLPAVLLDWMKRLVDS